MPRFPVAPAAAVLILFAPYVALGVWLEQTKGLQGLAAFVVSVGLMMWLLAMGARTWRRFLLIQFPLLILSAVFAAYTLIYGNPPGNSSPMCWPRLPGKSSAVFSRSGKA
jgi:hypothetical protein